MDRVLKNGILIFLLCRLLSFGDISFSSEKLEKELKLRGQQKEEITKILKLDKEQKAKDRFSHKGEPLLLIKLAKKRRDSVITAIEALLDSSQKEPFLKLKTMTLGERELFSIQEGVLINKDQAYHIEKIIAYYNNLIKVKLEEVKEIRDEFKHYFEGHPGRRAERGSRMIRRYAASRFKGLNKQKEKDIRTHLSKEQKKLYKKIVKFQKAKLKQEFKRNKR